MAFFTRKKPAPARTAPASAVPTGRASERDPAFERRVQELGAEFLRQARDAGAGVFSGSLSVFKDKLMDWAMQDEAFRVQLFRFVDCFPTLRTNDAIYDHLADYLSQPGVKPPPGFELGMAAGGLAKGLMAKTMAGQIEGMASKFIAGTDAASALPSLEKMWKNGLCFSVDLLGEACVSDQEARLYRQKYLDLVENLPKRVASWPGNPVLESDHLGAVPRTNVSIKISSLSARVDPIDTEGSIRTLMAEILPILESARKHGVGALLQGGARGSVRVTPRKPAALRGARVQVDIVGAIHGENFEAAHVEGVRDAPQLLHVVVELGAPDDGIEPRHDHRTALLGVSAARIVRGARYTLSEFQNGFMVDL